MNNQITKCLKILLMIVVILFNQFIVKAITKEKVQIKWYIQLNNDDSDPYTSGFYQYVEMYNNSQDRIELIIIPSYAGCSFDATDTLLMIIDEGDPPDITSLVYSEVREHFLNLTPYLEAYDLSNVDSAYFFKYRQNNVMPVIPLGIDFNTFFYNKDMFDSAGLAYPPYTFEENYADDDTWDIAKLEEIAIKLTFDDKDSNALSPEFNKQNISQFGFHPGWVNGISLTKMFGYPGFVNSDSSISVKDFTRQGYQWYHDGIWVKRFIANGQEHTNMNGDPLGPGQVAMSYTYSSYSGNLDDTLINWDIAAPPSYNGEINIPWGLVSFGIFNTCEHPEEALEVIFTIANTIEFYGTVIPVFKNLREAAMDTLISRLPDKNWQVLKDAINYIDVNTCDGDALYNNMAAWRLANDMRDEIFYDPYADIDGLLNGYYISAWEEIFKREIPEPPTSINFTMTNADEKRPLMTYSNFINSYADIIIYLENPQYIELSVFNTQGQKIDVLTEGYFNAGEHQIIWNMDKFSDGIYYCILYTKVKNYFQKLIVIH